MSTRKADRRQALMGTVHRTLLVVVGLLALASLAGIALLWPPSEDVDEQVAADDGRADLREDLIDATILEVEAVGQVDDPGLPPGARTVVIVAELDDTGQIEVFPMVDDHGDLYQAGDRVRLERFEPIEDGDDPTYAIADFRRGPALVALSAMFVLAVLAFGRFQGARALLGLGLTFALIIGFIVPAVLAGRSPLLVALAGSVAIMIATLYLSHGFNRKTTAAVIGTAGALAVTVTLGTLFVELASLTGLADEEARLANVQLGGVSLQGLLLAGIIIGALGVLDDVTMSQSSTVFALHRTDPGAGFGRLVASALSVGRDHVAATVNTLFLAYAGASLPLLILFITGPVGVEEVLTGELVAVEVVRTMVGSLGLIAAVPLSTVLAAALARGDADASGPPPGVEPSPVPHAASPPAGVQPPESPPAGVQPPASPPGGVQPPASPPRGATPPETSAPAAPEAAATSRGDEPGQDPTAAEAVDEPADEEEWERRLRQAYGLDEDNG